jgi:hypothetical protein
MDEQTTTTDTATTTTTTTTPVAAARSEAEPASTPAVRRGKKTIAVYAVTAIVVLMIAGGLWFFLEREGRVGTTVFSGVTAYLKQNQAAAVVNGTEISVLDFESTLRQIEATSAQQGVDTTDPAVAGDLRTQAIDSLVNTELLRQAAVAANIEVSDADVETRYQQIVQSIGGEEVLKTRMAELGLDDAMLRRDIRNDILIQSHIDATVPVEEAIVTEDEVRGFYDQVAANSPEPLPAFEEVRAEIEDNLLFQRQQEIVGTYVDSLRTEASIEVKI